MTTKLLAVSFLSMASLIPHVSAGQASPSSVRPAVYSSTETSARITPVVQHRHYYRRRHSGRRTAVRVGVGAAGGAAVGAAIGGGPGAAIGAVAGAGAGALYDHHERRKGN
ncbi:MAG: glycine zipper domain-containing protein [Acidobacteriota bacterium]|nr:glycine zipper domain-containing protein [Acidobacteriota bacterium]